MLAILFAALLTVHSCPAAPFIAVRVADAETTVHNLTTFSFAKEVDPYTHLFAGPQRHNAVGAVIGMALLDYVAFRLTKHNPVARCAYQAYVGSTSLRNVFVNLRRP